MNTANTVQDPVASASLVATQTSADGLSNALGTPSQTIPLLNIATDLDYTIAITPDYNANAISHATSSAFSTSATSDTVSDASALLSHPTPSTIALSGPSSLTMDDSNAGVPQPAASNSMIPEDVHNLTSAQKRALTRAKKNAAKRPRWEYVAVEDSESKEPEFDLTGGRTLRARPNK